MANVAPGGDVSQRGPREYLDPLAPLSSQLRQLESMMGLIFDDYDEFLRDLTQEILSLAPEERFTQSHEVLRDHMEAQFGSTDAFAAVLPESDPEKLPAVLEQLFGKSSSDVLEGVYLQRRPDDHLVLAALLQTLNYGIQRLEEADQQELKNRLGSTILALLCRLHRISAESPDSLGDDAIWDTAYGLHYVSVDDEGQDVPNPDQLSFDDAEQHVLEFGAVIAYSQLDISVSRGAELARTSTKEFRDLLDRYEIDPRFGPSTVEELSANGTDE